MLKTLIGGEKMEEQIKNAFFDGSTIERTSEMERAIEILLQADILVVMFWFTSLGKPALCGAAPTLEAELPKEFLQEERNRRNIGRALKFIMEQFGFGPFKSGLDKECRIPSAFSKLFSTSAVYEQKFIPKYRIIGTRIVKI